MRKTQIDLKLMEKKPQKSNTRVEKTRRSKRKQSSGENLTVEGE